MKFTTKVAYCIFPAYVWSILGLELKLALCRWSNYCLPHRRRLIVQLQHRRGLKIHLGCGHRIMSDWINIDAMAGDGIDLQWDLRCSLPFHDSSARMIYSEHLLEHLFKDDALNLLKECYRVLAPGGVARIGVPDAELYFQAYVEERNDFFAGLEHLGGAVIPLACPIDVINQMFRMGEHHRFAWDFLALSSALASIGFIEITRQEPGKASCAELCLDDPSHAFETLYVEALKPRL